MIEVVYATARAHVHLPNGETVIVQKGTHWPASDPVVRQSPDLFSADPRWGMLYTQEPAGYDAPIETASAVPGEKRNTRRG